MALEWLNFEQLVTWHVYSIPIVAIPIWIWQSIWDTQYEDLIERSIWAAFEGLLIGCVWPYMLVLVGLMLLVDAVFRATKPMSQ